ncbi:hypothetical protein HH303_13025 [Rhodospirillaceae bacterium KN72]|uniref:Beta-lactamase-related domain-containing protein n=1 Tax=Pacificispira spongiicola TaxID=2729598 RepID=A0A7Y0HF44_9PROT|nr:hypothetical protein [Pacificispira spongiicola]NMM45410.1 hypothetical protein [Pacificispira spongiicola]
MALSHEQFTRIAEEKTAFSGPVALTAFTPAGLSIGKADSFSGTVTLSDFRLEARSGAGRAALTLPDMTLGFTSYVDRLVPVPDAESVVIDRRDRFVLLFGVGRIWRESADRGRSRSLLPVSLVDAETGDVFAGLASFLYGDRRGPTPMVFQFSQETAPKRHYDIVGTATVTYTPGPLAGAESRIAAYETRQSTAPVYRDWDVLLNEVPALSGVDFDGLLGDQGDVSASGLIRDGVVYLRGCNTRAGRYPFCRDMRLGLGAMSFPLLGFTALAHIVHRYGDDVMDMTVGDLVPELRRHPKWRITRVSDLINMASGLGETTPQRAKGVVAADGDAAALDIRKARATTDKIAVASGFPSYPWPPGEVFRYRLADSFVLSLAMDRYLKGVIGPDASLRWVLQDRLFRAVGIPRLQMRMSAGNGPSGRVPDIGEGLFPTIGETVRLIRLLRDTQTGIRQTGLSRELVTEALATEAESGLPTGAVYPDGGGTFDLGFWRRPFRSGRGCLVHIPETFGRGGSVIDFIPDELTAFRFADGDPENPATRDSRVLRQAADLAGDFCPR